MSLSEQKTQTMRSVWAAGIVTFAAAGAHGQQIAKLTADDATVGDHFGISVSIDGDSAVVGAYFDNDAGGGSGSAYVFRADGGVWEEIAKLTADDAAAGDQFGISVSLSGDRVVVGARYDDGAGSDSGSAYIFREVGGVWQQVAKLTADDAAEGDEFGNSVSLDGDTAVIGALFDDNAGVGSGSVYVFREVGGVWRQIAKLTPNDAADGDRFGASVSLSGDTAIVGAHFDDDAGSCSGSAYIFREVAGVWQQNVKLTTEDAAEADWFGWKVALSGDTAVVGARFDDDAGTDSGSAYIFGEVGGMWNQLAKLSADDAAEGDEFGVSVAIDGDTAAIGAWRHDDPFRNSGAAYVFRAVAGVWNQIAKITADDPGLDEQIARSVALSGDMAVIGAHRDNDAALRSGAAYVFAVAPPCPADLNADGVLDFFDVSAFLNAYSAGEPAADFNADGRHDFFDLQTFLQAFSAGCP